MEHKTFGTAPKSETKPLNLACLSPHSEINEEIKVRFGYVSVQLRAGDKTHILALRLHYY